MTDPPSSAVVVGAAIVDDGRLLAARRVSPPPMAGGWEFPGGKVDPGESVADACVREIREELGCEIEVVRRLPGERPLNPGFVLHVLEARLVTGEPVPHEHDALRWLSPEDLDSVRWLDADRPFLHDLRERLLDGARLPGGNVGGAVRIGPTVRRPTGPWTPAVHALLDHLAAHGLDRVPRVHGYDERGREVLSFLPGTVVDADHDELTDGQLVEVLRWMREYHRTVASFRPVGPVRWRFEERAIADEEIVCHHDVAPYNLAFDGDRLAGVFDWDVAGPGTRLDDLAFAAWNCVPLFRPVAAAADRLRLMADTYGDVDPVAILHAVVPRIAGAVRKIGEGQRAGDPGMLNLASVGEPDRTARALDRLRERIPDLEAELSR